MLRDLFSFILDNLDVRSNGSVTYFLFFVMYWFIVLVFFLILGFIERVVL